MSQLAELQRRRDRAVVAGVCAAVGDRWRVDPTLVRVAAVLLALSGGIGLVVYAMVGLLTPTTDETVTPIARLVPGSARWPAWVWILIGVAGCLAIASVVGPAVPFGVMPAVILTGVWYFGYARTRRTGRPRSRDATALSPPPFPDTDFGRAAAAWRRRVDEVRQLRRGANKPAPIPADPSFGVRSPVAVPQPTDATRQAEWPTYSSTEDAVPMPGPAPASRRTKITPTGKVVRWCGLALAVVTLLVVAVGQMVFGLMVPPVVWVAAPTAAIGLALVAGAFLGHPRGLGILGALLLATTLSVGAVSEIAKVSDPEVRIVHTPESPAPASLDVNLGGLEVDLSNLPKATAPRTYRYSVDVGQLRVRLPKEGNFEVQYRAEFGAISAPGLRREGADLFGTTRHVTDPSASRTVLILEVQMGAIEVLT